jgi:hypothetical protein
MFLGLSTDKPGLKAVLENKKILKLLHDCRNDWDSLLYQYSIRLFNFIDTQEAYYIYVLFYKQELNLPISLKRFIREFTGKDLMIKSLMKNQMKEDVNFWKKRPLEHNMLVYASEDVMFLIKAWMALEKKLNKESVEIIKVLSIFKVVDKEMFYEFVDYVTRMFFEKYQRVVKGEKGLDEVIKVDYVKCFFEMKEEDNEGNNEGDSSGKKDSWGYANIVKNVCEYKRKQKDGMWKSKECVKECKGRNKWEYKENVYGMKDRNYKNNIIHTNTNSNSNNQYHKW